MCAAAQAGARLRGLGHATPFVDCAGTLWSAVACHRFGFDDKRMLPPASRTPNAYCRRGKRRAEPALRGDRAIIDVAWIPACAGMAGQGRSRRR